MFRVYARNTIRAPVADIAMNQALDKKSNQAPDVSPEKSGNQGDLAQSNGLASTDSKGLKAALRSNAGDSNAASFLQDVSMPMALNKDVMDEHRKLSGAAEKAIANPEARQQFKQSMDAFEQRADSQHLTSDQVTNTYKQMERIFTDTARSPFDAPARQQLAVQLMDKLGNVDSRPRQGWHDTCGWTVLESRLMTRDPDKISEKLADVITTGGVNTIDMKAAAELAAKGDQSAPPIKLLMIDASSLKPDQEAQGVSPYADRREYIDQLAQVMENNIKWDAQSITPYGAKVDPGTMHFEQCATITRPTDASAGLASAGKDSSCESVVLVDPETQKRVALTGSGYGFGGGASSQDLSLVNAMITGRFEPVLLQRTDVQDDVDQSSAMAVDSVDGLKAMLQGLKKTNQLPFSASVLATNPGIKEDLRVRSPEELSKVAAGNLWHNINVTGIDDAGNVQIYNPWGVQRTMSVEKLFAAMGRPAPGS